MPRGPRSGKTPAIGKVHSDSIWPRPRQRLDGPRTDAGRPLPPPPEIAAPFPDSSTPANSPPVHRSARRRNETSNGKRTRPHTQTGSQSVVPARHANQQRSSWSTLKACDHRVHPSRRQLNSSRESFLLFPIRPTSCQVPFETETNSKGWGRIILACAIFSRTFRPDLTSEVAHSCRRRIGDLTIHTAPRNDQKTAEQTVSPIPAPAWPARTRMRTESVQHPQVATTRTLYPEPRPYPPELLEAEEFPLPKESRQKATGLAKCD